jgi:hypothetical protein
MNFLDQSQLLKLIEHNDEATVKTYISSLRRLLKQHQVLLLKKALSTPKIEPSFLNLIYHNSTLKKEELPALMLDMLSNFSMSKNKVEWFKTMVPDLKYKDEWSKIINTQHVDIVKHLIACYYLPEENRSEEHTYIFNYNLFYLGRFAITNNKPAILDWVLFSQKGSIYEVESLFSYILLATSPLNKTLLTQVIQEDIRWTDQFKHWINEDKLALEFNTLFIDQSKRTSFKNLMTIVLKEHLDSNITQQYGTPEEDDKPFFKI